MERERWTILYELILRLGKSDRSGWKYPTTTIVAVYYWSVLHDRSIRWACDPANWNEGVVPPYDLPPQDRMSKRLKSRSVRELLAAVEAAQRTVESSPVKILDSKALAVAGISKDRAATWGRTLKKRWVRGYKLHVLWGGGPLPIAWRITGMNAQDGRASSPLLRQLRGRGFVLADSQYDHNARYDDAAEHGHQLLALHKENAGGGHRKHSPHRLRGLALTRHFRAWVRRRRTDVERFFGTLSCAVGGLAPLPAWVRGPERVYRWVQAKLVINALRIRRLQQAKLAMA